MTIIETLRYKQRKEMYAGRLTQGFLVAAGGSAVSFIASRLIGFALTARANELALTNLEIYKNLPLIYQHVDVMSSNLFIALSVVCIFTGAGIICLIKCPESLYSIKKSNVTVVDKAMVSLSGLNYKNTGEGKIYVGDGQVLRCDSDAYFQLNAGSKYDVWVNKYDSIGKIEPIAKAEE